jgi:predicted NAD/FAD-dependent oxidoreductase
MATRRTDHGTFDHGAQYFTARDTGFRRVVEGWLGAGIVAPYAGRIVRLQSAAAIPLSHDELRYVATPGMTAPCRALATGIDVLFECTVTAVTPGGDGWRVSWEEGGESGRPGHSCGAGLATVHRCSGSGCLRVEGDSCALLGSDGSIRLAVAAVF